MTGKNFVGHRPFFESGKPSRRRADAGLTRCGARPPPRRRGQTGNKGVARRREATGRDACFDTCRQFGDKWLPRRFCFVSPAGHTLGRPRPGAPRAASRGWLGLAWAGFDTPGWRPRPALPRHERNRGAVAVSAGARTQGPDGEPPNGLVHANCVASACGSQGGPARKAGLRHTGGGCLPAGRSALAGWCRRGIP